jgi:isopentenyl diphosphate isomerase/L-lactate dehydrogenase-like FMN-dependent dehydrogenase
VKTPVNVMEWSTAAVDLLPADVAGYLQGGAGDERTLAGNRQAFARLRLVPRVLGGHGAPDLTTTVLGRPVSTPIGIAPVGHQRLFHPNGEVETARAAADAGALFCLSTMANTAIDDLAAAVPAGLRWFQLYARREQGHRRDTVARAEAAGFAAIVVTVDVNDLGRRERDARSGFRLPDDLPVPNLVSERDGPMSLRDSQALLEPALSWTDIESIAGWTALPVVVKGVLHPADAVRAADHGCAAIVVSNHGGRQLDGSIATIDALPAIAAAVGNRLELYLDSGVRRGVDVLAALALGARAVLVGRPAMYGLTVDGHRGVAAILDLLRDELANAMVIAGVASVAAVPPDIVHG